MVYEHLDGLDALPSPLAPPDLPDTVLSINEVLPSTFHSLELSILYFSLFTVSTFRLNPGRKATKSLVKNISDPPSNRRGNASRVMESTSTLLLLRKTKVVPESPPSTLEQMYSDAVSNPRARTPSPVGLITFAPFRFSSTSFRGRLSSIMSDLSRSHITQHDSIDVRILLRELSHLALPLETLALDNSKS